jgi:hypothetical protein
VARHDRTHHRFALGPTLRSRLRENQAQSAFYLKIAPEPSKMPLTETV